MDEGFSSLRGPNRGGVEGRRRNSLAGMAVS